MKKNLLFALLTSIGLMGSAVAQTAPTFSGIALSPATGLAFPLTYLTQESQSLTATIKNTYLGSASTISTVASSDPQYVVTAETCTAAPLAKNGGACTVTVKYVPTAVSTASSAKINITRTTAGGNFWIPVTGIADIMPKVPSLPTATTFSGISQTPAQGLAFPELLPGLISATQRLTIKNTYLGSASTISAVTSSDPQFVVTAETCTAASLAKNGGSCTVDVAFKPAAVGTFAAKLNFTRPTAGGNFFANLAGIGKGITPTATGYTGATLTPTSLTFSDTAKGSTSVEQTITVKNTYAAASWTVNSVTSNILSYKVTSNDCGTLAPGATCTIKVAFAPTLVQALAGTITINRTVGTTTSNMIVKATGIGIAATSTAPLAASPASVAFDLTTVGTTQKKAVTLTNTGTANLTLGSAVITGSSALTISANTCTNNIVTTGASCTVTLAFAPSVSGSVSGTLSVTPTGGTAISVPVTGTGAMATTAQLRAEPGVVVLPSTTVGQTSSPITVNLSNAGSSPLTINSINSSAPGEFIVSSGCAGATLQPGASCSASVSFVPVAPGGRTGTLAISHNGVTSPSTIQVGGNGMVASDVYVEPTTLDLGSLPVLATSASRSVTFYNAAATALAIKPLALSGDATEFTQTNTCGTSLVAGGTCTATVSFKPTSTGTKMASLGMTGSSDNKLAQSVLLTGVAAQAQGILTASPTSLTFPSTTVGSTSAAQTVTLANTGTASVTVSQTAATLSDFSWTTTCGTVAPGASCTVSIKFNPSSSGAKTGALNMTHNGQGGSLTVGLSGAAAVLPGTITASPTSVAFPDTNIGATSPVKTVTLTNTGGSSLSGITATSSSSEIVVTHNCPVSLAVNASCTASLTFAPSTTGARTGNLSLNWTGASVPLAIGMSGNGIGVPEVTLSATSASFPATEVGQQSAAQAVTVTNSGTGTLAVLNCIEI